MYSSEGGGGACARYVLAGPGCHGVLWYEGRILYLLSSSGGIAQLSPDGRTDVLWSAGTSFFSKGLAILDNVAYFGLSAKQQERFTRIEQISHDGHGSKHRPPHTAGQADHAA